MKLSCFVSLVISSLLCKALPLGPRPNSYAHEPKDITKRQANAYKCGHPQVLVYFERQASIESIGMNTPVLCQQACDAKNDIELRCDTFLYDPMTMRCFLNKIKTITNELPRNPVAISFCTKAQVSMAVFPAGGCFPIPIQGTVLAVISGVSTPQACLGKCILSGCTHTAMKFNSKTGFCKIIKENTKAATVYLPTAGESICTRYRCGQWIHKGILLEDGLSPDVETCLRKCKARPGCSVFKVIDSIDPKKAKRCLLYDKSNSNELVYYGQDKICSVATTQFTNRQREKHPDFALLSPQTKLYGLRIIPLGASMTLTHERCLDLCRANPLCAHVLLNRRLDIDYCSIVRKDAPILQQNQVPTNLIKLISGEETFAKVKVPVDPISKNLGPFPFVCGKWIFNGMLLATGTVANEALCKAECKGDCDAFMFDRRPGQLINNCYLFNSRVAGSLIGYYTVNELCSQRVRDPPPSIPAGGCPQSIIVARELEGTITESISACHQKCITSGLCSHALFSPFFTCRILTTVAGAGQELKEILLWPGESACSRSQLAGLKGLA